MSKGSSGNKGSKMSFISNDALVSSWKDVFACEILEKDIIGNLRNNNLNFLKIWNNEKNKKLRQFISKTNCNCTYECALSYNFMSNLKYQYKFAKSFIDI